MPFTILQVGGKTLVETETLAETEALVETEGLLETESLAETEALADTEALVEIEGLVEALMETEAESDVLLEVEAGAALVEAEDGSTLKLRRSLFEVTGKQFRDEPKFTSTFFPDAVRLRKVFVNKPNNR